MNKIIKNAITVSMVSMIALNPVITFASTYTNGATGSNKSSYSTNKSSYSRTYTRSTTYTKPGYKPSKPSKPDNSSGSKPGKPDNSNVSKPSKPDDSSNVVKPTPPKNNGLTINHKNGTVSRTYSRKPKKDNETNNPSPNKPNTPVQPNKPDVSKPTKPIDPIEPSKPNPPVDTIDFNTSKEVKEMYSLINEARAKSGLKPLELNKELTAVAQKKSDDMVENNYLSHSSKKYGTVYQMISDAGIEYYNAGENISKHYTIQTAFDGFMGSSLHRNAILADHFTDVGIGVTKTSTGMVKISVMFIEER